MSPTEAQTGNRWLRTPGFLWCRPKAWNRSAWCRGWAGSLMCAQSLELSCEARSRFEARASRAEGFREGRPQATHRSQGQDMAQGMLQRPSTCPAHSSMTRGGSAGQRVPHNALQLVPGSRCLPGGLQGGGVVSREERGGPVPHMASQPSSIGTAGGTASLSPRITCASVSQVTDLGDALNTLS